MSPSTSIKAWKPAMSDEAELAAIQARAAGTILSGGYEAEADRRTLLRLLNEAREMERGTRIILDGYKLAADTAIKERDEARAEIKRLNALGIAVMIFAEMLAKPAKGAEHVA